MATEQGRQRLAERVRRERLTRGRTQLQLATAGGMSLQTWRNVENALPAKDRTYSGVDRALDWTTGTAERMAEGVGDQPSVESPVDIIEAIRTDPTLSERAREHLASQYAILREWSSVPVAGASAPTPTEGDMNAKGRERMEQLRALRAARRTKPPKS